MKLYNTLSRSVADVEPIKPGAISLYTCGPTVYLDPHIGNWRMFIFYDVLARTLRGAGFNVTHVLNLTDVGHLVSDADDGEDKLEKTAHAQKKTAWDVAEHYIGVFKQGMKDLHIQKPDHLPRATDFMQQQIDLVKILEERGHTYQIDDGIYFDTSTFKEYGAMARLNISGQEEGARVSVNQQKKNPQDFAVWKFSEKGSKRDMEWESPWGIGFPGWHLECSAMAASLLGPHIDIHAGGIDHIPVHHTNEIAQSEAAYGEPFSRVWVHGAFMNVDGSKMSKSLGNIYTIEDIKKRGFEALDFRMLVLMAQYRTHQNFTWDALMSAQSRRKNLQALADRRYQAKGDRRFDYKKARLAFMAAMQHDINTPKALSVISDLESHVEKHGIQIEDLNAFIEFFDVVDHHLGLGLLTSQDITSQQKQRLQERDKARDVRDYATSDAIRDELEAEGLLIDDSAFSTVWRRK